MPTIRFCSRAPKKAAALAILSTILVSTVSTQALACACGCGVFDAGGLTEAPNAADSGLSAWFRYANSDQNRNFEGSHFAPAADNSDKRIQTSFYTFGLQYMINHDWGVMVEAPLYSRSFTTIYDDVGDIGKFNLNALGDIRVMGMYSGFSPDHSTGVLFGLKLPTGQWKSPTYTVNGMVYSYAGGNGIYDRDTMPGTGSTDFIIGAYHFGNLSADGKWGYLTKAIATAPFMTVEGYKPGAEIDAAAGVLYDLGAAGPATKITPLLQALASIRGHDSGANALYNDSGYERLFIAPSFDIRFGKFKFYAEIDIPVWQRVNAGSGAAAVADNTSGQLVASPLYKVQLGYDF